MFQRLWPGFWIIVLKYQTLVCLLKPSAQKVWVNSTATGKSNWFTAQTRWWWIFNDQMLYCPGIRTQRKCVSKRCQKLLQLQLIAEANKNIMSWLWRSYKISCNKSFFIWNVRPGWLNFLIKTFGNSIYFEVQTQGLYEYSPFPTQ